MNMFPVPSTSNLALPLAFVGVVAKVCYDAMLQEAQAIRNFAGSLIKVFQDQIPPTCREKKDQVQVVDCFLNGGQGAIVIHRERSPELIRDVQEYVGQSRAAKDRKMMTIALLILSGMHSLYILAEIIGRVRNLEHLISSPWTLAIPTVVLMAVVPILIQDAESLKDRTGPDFASSLIKICKDRIPRYCREKEDDLQAVKCFLVEGEGAISVSREESKKIIHAFQKYEGKNRVAREMTTVAVTLIIGSAIFLSSYCGMRIRRVLNLGNG